ncbi:hypothetical protein RJ639_032641 [Escallonia herrerae]|uniref:Pentatricopeptide repeat-containing protein n=1 Tax=Escallonia herrerae TaxID=1293975 RepID=A0AA88WXE5_9ASTE|nr:hypothetical protein RJ639_032641 [Escallonia herrerae]
MLGNMLSSCLFLKWRTPELGRQNDGDSQPQHPLEGDLGLASDQGGLAGAEEGEGESGYGGRMVLQISGERTTEQEEEKTHRRHYVERSSAKFVHRFRLRENVRIWARLDIVSYTTVITGLCQTGKLDFVLALVEEIYSDELELDLVTFNILIDWLYRKNGLSAAEKLWRLMESVNIIC